MRRIAFLAMLLTLFLGVTTQMSVQTAYAADSTTVNGLDRRQCEPWKGQCTVNQGEAVLGASIWYNNTRYTNCYITSAPSGVTVQDGVINYWPGEPANTSAGQCQTYVPPQQQTTAWFGPSATVYGGVIYLNGQYYCTGCTISVGPNTTGYVVGGSVSYPPPYSPPNPCPSGGSTPYCTVNGMAERGSIGTWSRINQNEAAYGDTILLDNGRACSVGNCYVEVASSGGWVKNGWVNPISWRLSGSLVKNW